MLTSVLYFIVVTAVILLCCSFVMSIMDNKEKYPLWMVKVAKFLYNNIKERYVYSFWLCIILITPFVFEFGYIFGRGYTIIRPLFSESNKVELKKLNWFGVFQPIGTSAYSFSTPKIDSDIAELKYAFVITDSKRGLYTSFDLIFEIDLPRFVQQSVQSGIFDTDALTFRGDIDDTFKSLRSKFQNSDFAVEDLQDNAILIAEEWLKENNITSVKSIKIKKDTGQKNPDRSVKME